MNAAEAGRILAIAISLDPKMPQPDAKGFIRGVWAKALNDVPFEAAEAAVMAYYRSDEYAKHRETVSPADIAQWWNARRRPTERERTGLSPATRRELPAAGFDPERLRSGVDRVRAALASGRRARAGEARSVARQRGQEDAVAQRSTRSRPCGHCGADVGQPCVDGNGRPLKRSPAHPTRLAALRDVQGAPVNEEDA